MADWRQYLFRSIQQFCLIATIGSILIWAGSYVVAYTAYRSTGTTLTEIKLLNGGITVITRDSRRVGQLKAGFSSSRSTLDLTESLAERYMVEEWNAQSIFGFGLVVGNRFSVIRIPLPLIAAILLLSWAWLRQHPRRRRHIANGVCLRCGYDLRGSTTICPECGLEFNNSALIATPPPPRPVLNNKLKTSDPPAEPGAINSEQ